MNVHEVGNCFDLRLDKEWSAYGPKTRPGVQAMLARRALSATDSPQ
jgi:hypothetical protein